MGDVTTKDYTFYMDESRHPKGEDGRGAFRTIRRR